MDYFHPFTIVIITLEDGYYWADGLFYEKVKILFLFWKIMEFNLQREK